MKPLSPGHYIIQPSANSKVRSLITKQKHPRKVTLPCNCHFTIHHDCNKRIFAQGNLLLSIRQQIPWNSRVYRIHCI
uniref:Pathogenesis enhancement protein n=1 Tax=Beet curly top virus TaxID=10840 RepID=A0A0N7EJD6_9GEMI|nr:pathogenesis enhancement protein [Beet curly top virus]ALF37826.1 pathogenesis enhancement protein [Beet curly top virus]